MEYHDFSYPLQQTTASASHREQVTPAYLTEPLFVLSQSEGNEDNQICPDKRQTCLHKEHDK